MIREVNVVDLIDSSNGRYLGQALYCSEIEDCPVLTVNNRLTAGELAEAFAQGVRFGGADINLYHINMPIEINTINTPYNELRNTIVGEMKIRNVKNKSQRGEE